MAETSNYGLYIEDDPSVPFEEWWIRINGTTDSNAIKIDKALAELAAQIASISSSLAALSGTDSAEA